MAKESGLGFSFIVDDAAGTPRTISNDVLNLDFATPREEWDVTGIDKSAKERLLLLADFTVEPTGAFNDAVNFSHAVYKTVPSTSVMRTHTLSISGQSLAGELLVSDYALTRAEDGKFTWKAPAALADGTVPTWS